MLDLKSFDHLSRLDELNEKGNQILYVSIDKIVSSRLQPRNTFLSQELNELADNIRTNGILQPIIVRKVDNKYEIIAGERRWRAAKIAELDKMPVIVKNFDDRNTLLIALTENLQREDLHVIELAKGYKSLAENFALTHEEISNLLSIPRVTITNIMRLLSLGDLAMSYLVEGVIDAGHARALLSLKDSEQDKAVQEIVDKKMNVRQTEQYVKNFNIKKNLHQKKFYTQLQIESLKNSLNMRTKKSISITPNSKNEKVKVTIEFDSLEDADSFFN